MYNQRNYIKPTKENATIFQRNLKERNVATKPTCSIQAHRFLQQIYSHNKWWHSNLYSTERKETWEIRTHCLCLLPLRWAQLLVRVKVLLGWPSIRIQYVLDVFFDVTAHFVQVSGHPWCHYSSILSKPAYRQAFSILHTELDGESVEIELKLIAFLLKNSSPEDWAGRCGCGWERSVASTSTTPDQIAKLQRQRKYRRNRHTKRE